MMKCTSFDGNNNSQTDDTNKLPTVLIIVCVIFEQYQLRTNIDTIVTHKLKTTILYGILKSKLFEFSHKEKYFEQ